jgi:dTDP-4-dehydrorhamnose reductase
MKRPVHRPLILLLGRNGQVGSELIHTLATFSNVVAWGRNEADLAHPDQLKKTVGDLAPDIIVNAAAYTAVDKAETERELAAKINATSVGILAELARKKDALLIHYSTDYVFDGTKREPYDETDVTNPVNSYGATKLAGEDAIRNSGCRHFIFRTTWVYSWTGNNFLKTMLRLGREREELAIVGDQFGAPTWSRMIAETTAQAISQVRVAPEKSESGVYNLSAAGRTSWHGFADGIFRLARTRGELGQQLKIANVRSIPSSDYPTPARRPANSELTHDKLWNGFGLRLPDWKDSLRAMMELHPAY